MNRQIPTENLPPLEAIFTVKTANEWLCHAKKRPVPKMLFGEFWLEGELAILFADTGKGKSILAVQIAECLARGRSIAPLQMNAAPQKVLYLDFELSDKQFEMRYAAEHDAEKGEFLKNHYRFSDRLCRVEIDINAEVPASFRSYDDYLHHSIERLLTETKAKILIVDNITYLKRSNESTREALPLMKELKRLKKELGLSILVLAHTPKRSNHRPITVNDLQGSKVLSNFADNIFAIGDSRQDAAGRYIKQIKPRSTEMIYDATHVPSFKIARFGGNFLGFQYQSFEPESELLVDGLDQAEWELIEQIKKMSDSGRSVRAIAEELEMSKSAVHRKLHMWKPSKNAPSCSTDCCDTSQAAGPEHYFRGAERCLYEKCGGCSFCRGRPGNRFREISENIQGHAHCPDDCRLCGPRIYTNAEGVKPELKKASDKFLDELSAWLIGGKCGPRPKYAGPASDPAERDERSYDEELDHIDARLARSVDDEYVDDGDEYYDEEEPAGGHEWPDGAGQDPEVSGRQPSTPELSVRYDGHGEQIFVESEYDDGTPKVWYKYGSKGRKYRHDRSLSGITVTRVHDQHGQADQVGV